MSRVDDNGRLRSVRVRRRVEGKLLLDGRCADSQEQLGIGTRLGASYINSHLKRQRRNRSCEEGVPGFSERKVSQDSVGHSVAAESSTKSNSLAISFHSIKPSLQTTSLHSVAALFATSLANAQTLATIHSSEDPPSILQTLASLAWPRSSVALATSHSPDSEMAYPT